MLNVKKHFSLCKFAATYTTRVRVIFVCVNVFSIFTYREMYANIYTAIDRSGYNMVIFPALKKSEKSPTKSSYKDQYDLNY